MAVDTSPETMVCEFISRIDAHDASGIIDDAKRMISL